MNKYLVTVQFEWQESAMQLIPEHREYINRLIEQQLLEHYVVSMEVQRIWLTIRAESKEEVEQMLSKTPFYPYWTLEIAELIVWDGQNYRLPALQLN